MPDKVAAVLRADGLLRANRPHAPSTVRRRLSSWSTLTRWRGLRGRFNAPGLRSALKLAVRASARPRTRKSTKAKLDLPSAAGQIRNPPDIATVDAVRLPAAKRTGARRYARASGGDNHLFSSALISESSPNYPGFRCQRSSGWKPARR